MKGYDGKLYLDSQNPATVTCGGVCGNNFCSGGAGGDLNNWWTSTRWTGWRHFAVVFNPALGTKSYMNGQQIMDNRVTCAGSINYPRD